MIAESVYPISYADLRENGGAYKLTRDAEAVIAIPSYDVSAKATQGEATPVYCLSNDEVSWNGGPFKVIQSQNARVVKFVPGGRGALQPETARVGQARPVYVIGGVDDYYLKLLRLFGRSIIGYWPMWEPSGAGAVAYDQSRNRFDGRYVGVTLGQPGIGDGRTCPLYDGVADFMNYYSAALNAAVNKQEGSAFIWLKASSGVWSDGFARRIFVMYHADALQKVFEIQRTAVNGQLAFGRFVAGVSESITWASGSPAGFIHLGVTWSQSADKFTAYALGSQVGQTTGLGAWDGGALRSDRCLVGAQTTVPGNPFSGYLSHALILNRAATVAEVAAAAVIQ